MELIKLAAIGIVLGITTVIPGVSVGTIAVVFNIYDRLIAVITPNVKKILAAWKFLLPLFIGGVAGIIFFSKIVTLLFDHYRVPTYGFFIGIIAGSIPLIYRRVQKPDSALPSFPAALCCILALALMVVMAIFKPTGEAALYTDITPQLFAMLAAGGMLAAAAMIIPGISGAFLLLVIGQYFTILKAVSELNVSLIVPVALGAIIGLLIGAAFVRFLLAKAPRETYGAVLGLVVGSIVVLYLQADGLRDGLAILVSEGDGVIVTIIVSIACFFAGCAISFFSGRQKHEPETT